MKATTVTITALLGLILSVLALGFASPGMSASAEEHPGVPMCNGRKDPNVVITAHANGRSATKYILNIRTDASGAPDGVLVLGRGNDRLIVEDWCRVWQHLPEQPYPEQCEEGPPPEGAITAHAVGTAMSVTGERLLVRTDMRETGEGRFFRVRYRELPGGEDHEPGEEPGHEPGEEDGCEDETWTRIPAEGWAPLDQMRVRAGLD